jgi:hypothetical protein
MNRNELALVRFGCRERGEPLTEEAGIVERRQRERVPGPRGAPRDEASAEIAVVPDQTDAAAHLFAGYGRVTLDSSIPAFTGRERFA